MKWLRLNGGRIGDAVRGFGGTLVSLPLNMSDVNRCFGDVEHVSQVVKLLRVVQHEVPAKANNHKQTSRMLEIGNDRSIQKNLPQIWEIRADDVMKNMYLVLKTKAVARL